MLRVLPDVWTARVLPDPRALGRVPSLWTLTRLAARLTLASRIVAVSTEEWRTMRRWTWRRTARRGPASS
eukprot:scaffold25598_cov56-Phaeocystis_antarctica.AAC.4